MDEKLTPKATEKKPKREHGRVVALPQKVVAEMESLSKASGIPLARIRKTVEAEVARHLASFDLKAAIKNELFG
jgi:hypothetical protein